VSGTFRVPISLQQHGTHSGDLQCCDRWGGSSVIEITSQACQPPQAATLQIKPSRP